jgi:hypothetical protein
LYRPAFGANGAHPWASLLCGGEGVVLHQARYEGFPKTIRETPLSFSAEGTSL